MIATITLSILLVMLGFAVSVVYLLTKKSEAEGLTPKEFAYELFTFIFLIPSVFAFVQILFMAIDKKWEDALSVMSYSNGNEDLAFLVSVLSVTFPIYLILSWKKFSYLKTNVSRLKVKAFEYGIYLTLFVTGLFLISSLISIIYNFLLGELSTAVALKVLVVVIVSLLLFVYSYISLQRLRSTINWSNAYSVASTIFAMGLVVAAIIYSVSVIGSPMEMRKKRFDNLRLQNISEIQNQILTSWQEKYTLPENLNDLKDGMGFVNTTLKDPQTKENYIYKIIKQSAMEKQKGENCRKFYTSRFASISDTNSINCEIPSVAEFELCATFNTIRNYDELGVEQTGSIYRSNKTGMEFSYFSEYDKNPAWNHPAGLYCFVRTVDPHKYPSYK